MAAIIVDGVCRKRLSEFHIDACLDRMRTHEKPQNASPTRRALACDDTFAMIARGLFGMPIPSANSRAWRVSGLLLKLCL